MFNGCNYLDSGIFGVSVVLLPPCPYLFCWSSCLSPLALEGPALVDGEGVLCLDGGNGGGNWEDFLLCWEALLLQQLLPGMATTLAFLGNLGSLDLFLWFFDWKRDVGKYKETLMNFYCNTFVCWECARQQPLKRLPSNLPPTMAIPKETLWLHPTVMLLALSSSEDELKLEPLPSLDDWTCTTVIILN